MKIAIVGGTQSWQDAPFTDKSWSIWVLGNQVQQYDHKRVDKIFEIHNDLSNRPPNYAQWLADLKFPMVVGDEFPVTGELIEKFDFAKARAMMQGDYLTSTPAYMTAYALYAHPDVEEIGYWGIDMAVDDREYFYEQPCINRWIGYCLAKGIKITLPEGCPLGEPNYMEGVTANKPKGVSPYTEEDFMELANDHQEKINGYQAEITRLSGLIQTHGGALQAYTRLAKVARATDAGQVFGNLRQTVRMISGNSGRG